MHASLLECNKSSNQSSVFTHLFIYQLDGPTRDEHVIELGA